MQRTWVATSVVSLGLLVVSGGCIFASDPGAIEEGGEDAARMDGGQRVDADAGDDVGGTDATGRDTGPADTGVEPTCGDETQNGQETDVDCGGPDCEACEAEQSCSMNSDCQSGVCDEGVCAAPSCGDEVQNGGETDVDCGGPDCEACEVEKSCEAAEDCESEVCQEGACVESSCGDDTQNGGETDVDCGGPDCGGCEPGAICERGTDCQSGVCNDDEVCAEPSCEDESQNGDETDIDCGGPNCDACAVSQSCQLARDCETPQCVDGTCVHGIQGNLTENSPGRWSDGTLAESCEAYRRPDDPNYAYAGSTRDGKYRIEPSNSTAPFVVTCDMTTDGGGWTRIRRCVAENRLGGTLQTQGDIQRKGIDDQCRPYTRHPNRTSGPIRHAAKYTFTFRPGFSEFRLEGFVIKANSNGFGSDGTEASSEIDPGGAVMGDWLAFGPGDVGFGDEKRNGPETSFARVLSSKEECYDCTISWPSGAPKLFTLPSTTTSFSIGWRETSNFESEGWYGWWDGYIYLR